MQSSPSAGGRNHDLHTHIAHTRIADRHLSSLLDSNDTVGVIDAITGAKEESRDDNCDS